MNKIPNIHVPLEHFVVWQGGFSDDEIQKIIAIGELAEFNKGHIGSGEDSKVSKEIRDTDITWIEPSEGTRWIYDRMAQLAAKINYDKFQFDLSHFQPLQYGKYKIDGHYNWHYDCGPNLPEHRKLSFVLGLSDPDDYEGGELQLNIHGDTEKAHSFKIRKGDLIVFPSYLGHRVTPVTSGNRITVVGWAIGPKFK